MCPGFACCCVSNIQRLIEFLSIDKMIIIPVPSLRAVKSLSDMVTRAYFMVSRACFLRATQSAVVLRVITKFFVNICHIYF